MCGNTSNFMNGEEIGLDSNWVLCECGEAIDTTESYVEVTFTEEKFNKMFLDKNEK